MTTTELELKKAELARLALTSDDESIITKALKLFKRKEKEEKFERIPGLAYTHEERMAELRLAEEGIKLGHYISQEELEEEAKSW